MLDLDKSQLTSKYLGHIGDGVAKSQLSKFDWAKKRLRSHVGDELFSTYTCFLTDETSKAYCYSIAISLANVLTWFIP